MLTGQAKTDYQRGYMRRYRAKNKDSVILSRKQPLRNVPESPRTDDLKPVGALGLTVRPPFDPVRPYDVRPELDADGNILPEFY